MPNYPAMYAALFNAITDALDALKTGDISDARRSLMAAQQKTEEMYIDGDDP